MEYFPLLNDLLEALAYLGRRAAGNTAQLLLDRLESNGVTDLDDFRQRLAPLAAMMERLDRCLEIPEEDLHSLFGNLAGFPYNTIGSASPAFLLFYPLTAGFTGDLSRVLAQIQDLDPAGLAAHLAISLDIVDEDSTGLTSDEFSTRVLDLSIPAETKVAILDLYHRPWPTAQRAATYLSQAILLLREEHATLTQICRPFSAEIKRTGLENFLEQTSGLSRRPDAHYSVHPFVFGMDTNLSLTLPGGGPVQLYCGILRGPLQAMLASARGPEYDVYNAIKLLGDRTRFDILCYLRDHQAYGQELSSRFGLSRNTIHHHMSKLLAARLVSCTVDGNRVYYTVNRSSVSALLDRQRALLLPDPEK